MKKYSFLILFILIGIISCKEKSKDNSILIPLSLTSNKDIAVKVSQILNIGTLNIQEQTGTVDGNNPFVIKKKPNKLTMCTLLAKDTMAIFFISPDTERKIAINRDEKNKIHFVFDKNDHINNFTNSFHKQIRPLMDSNLNEKPLFELIEKTENKLLKQLQQLKPNIDTASYNTLKSMVTGKMTHIKYMHSERFPSLNSNSSYFDFVNGFTFDDDNYLTYSDNLNTVLGVLSTQYERKYNKSFDDADNQFDFVNNSIKNNEVKSAIICFLTSRIIPEQTEVEKEELLSNLNQFSIKSSYLEHIKNIKASTATGKKIGNKAKYLETLISYNKDFSIKQLEGKTVYIDNWATWCGPCVKSMEKFKVKQKELTNIKNVIYVFISFDRNENIWRKYVEKSLTSNQHIIHLYNGANMNSKYGTYYNITALPNYFIINKQGLIHDINPPEPSDSNFGAYLKKI